MPAQEFIPNKLPLKIDKKIVKSIQIKNSKFYINIKLFDRLKKRHII